MSPKNGQGNGRPLKIQVHALLCLHVQQTFSVGIVLVLNFHDLILKKKFIYNIIYTLYIIHCTECPTFVLLNIVKKIHIYIYL